MELYLIRHGIAEERSENKKDELRELTEIGREKTKKVAKQIKTRCEKFDLILTSPLIRAEQTARICQEIGLSDQMLTFPDLKPDGDLNKWVKWWQESGYNNEENKLALVGHQPDLGNWTELLVWGKSEEKLIVKKAGVIGLKLPINKNPIANSELFLLTSPKWLME